MNQSQICPISESLPLLVIISMRQEGAINHSIDIDAVKADGHVENLVLLRGPKDLLVLYNSILTAHSVIKYVRLTRIRRVLRRHSVHDNVNIICILFEVCENI